MELLSRLLRSLCCSAMGMLSPNTHAQSQHVSSLGGVVCSMFWGLASAWLEFVRDDAALLHNLPLATFHAMFHAMLRTHAPNA